MKSLAFLACLLGATATTASAWVEQNPAFPRGQAPKAVPLSVITGAGSATAYTFATQDQKTAKLVLAVGEKGGTTLAITDQSGKAVYGPKTVASTAYLPKQVYTGDLNQDGKPDYVIAVESGGNGVAADLVSVVVVLSGPGDPRVWAMSSYSFLPEDVFQTPQGGTGLIQADYTGGIRGKDGKKHYFIAYQSYAVAQQEIKPLPLAGFPKLLLMTNEYRSADSTALNAAQKAALFKKIAGPKEP